MRIQAYICPPCGAPLNVKENATFTFCSQCGCKIHVSYEGEEAPRNPNLRQFTDAATGALLASAVVPPDYILEGKLAAQWQSDQVPFTAPLCRQSVRTAPRCCCPPPGRFLRTI